MLKDREQVIVKFCQREEYVKNLKAKNNLRKLNTTNQDLPEDSKISFNQSLCCHYRLLWSTSKNVYGKGRSLCLYISNASVLVKLQENSRTIFISHMGDFRKHFLGVDFRSL